VTIAVLKKAVSNYFAIATKGKAGLKTKDIDGGLAAINKISDKDNLKQLIQEQSTPLSASTASSISQLVVCQSVEVQGVKV
jgi:hypothetical protein